MKPIKSFFKKIRQQFFRWRVNREIFHQISPHLRKEADRGYQFQSKDELVAAHIRLNLQVGLNLRIIERMAANMPKFQGDAFRLIAYRDLNERIQIYMELAEGYVHPETCDSRFIPTHA